MNEYEPFKITVDDGYCAWEFVLDFGENGEELSIIDIIEAICKELEGKEVSRKLVKEFEP